MSARKSLSGWLSRYSRSSNKTQDSKVLNSDSDGISDNEANPLWYKNFENHSIRPSARFSLAHADSVVLNSDSEPDKTPLQRNWWKHVPNTPYREPSGSNISAEKSNAQERSNVESSDSSLTEERVRKPRHIMRHNKRKSIGTSEFAKILDMSENSVTLKRKSQSKSNVENRGEISTPSDSDVSIEKVRKQPFKKRTTRQALSFNVRSSSNESNPEHYQDALDSLQSPNETKRDAISGNKSASSQENQNASLPGSSKIVSQQLEDSSPKKRRITANDSKDDNLEASISPLSSSRLKIRAKFTETTKRKTPNFDEILNNASKDTSSIREEEESNHSLRSTESLTQDPDLPTHILAHGDESDSEDSITRQRVPFAYKKRKNRQEYSFAQHMTSPNTSAYSEPLKTTSKRTADLNLSQPQILSSDVARRSSKRRSTLAKENQLTKELNRSSSNGNKFGAQRQSMNEEVDQAKNVHHSNIASENNVDKSGAERQSTSTKNTKSAEISHYSDIELEDDQSVSTERRSTNENNDRAEISRSLIVELKEDRVVSRSIRPSSGHNKSDAERQSVNKTKDNVDNFSSLSMEVEEEESIVYKKPRTSDQNRISSNNSPVNKSLSSTQAKDASHSVSNISSNKEIEVSINEEKDGDNISTNIENPPNNISINNQTENNEQSSNDSRAQRLDLHSANMQTTVLMDLANKIVTQKKTVPSIKLGPRTSNLGKEFASSPGSSRDAIKEKSTLSAVSGLENAGVHGSEFTGVGSISHSATNITERSFASPNPIGTRSIQIDPSQSSNVEEVSQLKIALEEVKRKGLGAFMTNTKIDSYFKRVKSTKPTVSTVENSQKVPKTIKPVGNPKTNASKTPNKAYLVNGKVYKRPPLPRPKSWATNRLYQYLWKKMEPKYKLKTRIRSEKFLIDLSHVVALVVRRKKYENYVDEMEQLIYEMARLGIIETRNDFHIFCRDFLPYEFRVKVIPMFLPGSVSNIPFEPGKLHTPILESQNRE